jgi:hypothetical protein
VPRIASAIFSPIIMAEALRLAEPRRIEPKA